MIRNLIKEILFLKKGEQRAMLVISFILLASLLFRLSISRKQAFADPPDEEFIAQIENLRNELEILEKNRKVHYTPIIQSIPELNPHTFDPNSVSQNELAGMGFSERLISNIIKYRKAGGVFYRPEGLAKIYGMDSASYLMLVDFIVIERGNKKQHKQTDVKGSHNPALLNRKYESHKPRNTIEFELNSADSLDLIGINGIGPVYSSRIIRYRAMLGGFYTQEQLWEIYGMDSLKYNSLAASTYVDSSIIMRKDINNVSYSSLIRHPYFNRKEVSDLIHYRNFAGEIKTLTELKANQVIDSTAYEKIKHYLKCGINKF